MSCSKTVAQKSAPVKVAAIPHEKDVEVAKPAPVKVSANPNEKDMGEVMLTNHYERSVSLGNGKNCLMMPRLLDKKTVRITMSLQSFNADGGADGLSVMQVTAKQGKPFEVVIGGMDLTMTPKVAE